MRSRAFRRLWAASAISNVGDGVRLTALPLLATELTSDARLIASVAVAERLPALVLTLPGGVLADRFDRRLLRVRLDVLRALVVGSLAVLAATDQANLAAVIVAAVVLGGAETIVDTSSLALLPAVVSDADLERANGVMTSTELVADMLLGPPLGGVLFAVAVALPLGVDAMSFLVAAAIVATIAPLSGTRPQVPIARSRFMSELAEGGRALWRQPLLRNLALVSVVLGFANLVHNSVFVLFARQNLGLGPLGFGLFAIAPALGGVAGSMAAARLTRWPLRVVLTATIVVSGVTVLLISTTNQPFVVAALYGVEAFAILAWNVITTALRQRLTPDAVLGRVVATYRFFVLAAMPLGAMAGGLIGESTSLSTNYVVAGVIELAVACALPWAIGPHRLEAAVAPAAPVT